MGIRTFDSLPSTLETYGNVIKSALPLDKVPVINNLLGAKPKAKGKTLPDATYVVNNLAVEVEHLKKYNNVCGFKDNGFLPPSYLCVLSQTLQMNMMVQEAFPFPMLGLVHISNGVTQHRPVAQYEVIELACAFGELRPHDKGQQFDFITTGKVDGELVYEATTTYLVRGKSSGGGDKKPSEKQVKPVPSKDSIHGIWKVPENIGRTYAPISGDFNLIHIHAVTAKAFGFPTAIAHGMWSMARSIAELGDLPHAFTVDVAFKLPILLPAQVELIGEESAAKDKRKIDFTLYDAKSDKPHIVGTMTEL